MMKYNSINLDCWSYFQIQIIILFVQILHIFSCILFGGMTDNKEKITSRISLKPATLKPHPLTTQKQPQTFKIKQKNPGIKRPTGQKSLFAMGFKKQEIQVVNQPKQILYSVKQLLKQTKFIQILQNCPKVKELSDLLCMKSFISQNLVYSCLDKYFHGNTTSLWSTKYAPRQFNELFQADFAQKIQQWIRGFYYFRKEAQSDNQLSFIDDQPSQSYNKSLQNTMNKNGWNCQALILRGRNGVGKASLVKAIAKSMTISLFEYASDVDQLQKMKQLVDGSQSEVVTNLQPKKKQQQNNKIMKENNSITMFICQKQNKKQQLMTKQPKRLQLFRNFTQYYPSSDKIDKGNAQDNYLKLLFGSIDKSPIPYILTTDKLQISFRQKNLNEKFTKFDEIQFEQNTIQDLTYLYWTIFQIENNLTINTSNKIKKQNLFSQINSQFYKLSFTCADVLDLIRQLVITANKKPFYILKYLQFKVHLRRLPKCKIFQDEEFKNNLDESSYFSQAICELNNEITKNINSTDLISNFQWVLYNKNYEPIKPLEQTTADESQKQQKIIEKTATKAQQIQIQKKPCLKQIRRQLELQVVQNLKILKNNPLNFKDNIEENQQAYLNIPTQIFLQHRNVHIQAKKQILKNVKRKIKEQKQKWDKKFYCNINVKQFYYLPLLFPEKRTSRILRKQLTQPLQENLDKLFNPRQMAYMQKFGKFIIGS